MASFDETLPGAVQRNDEGECWRMDRRYPAEDRFGRLPLERLREFPGPLAATLSGEPRLAALERSSLAYFDTETTGLGGAGTKIFLAGVGAWNARGDAFEVRQYLLRDYEDEPSLLLALHEDLARYPAVVTYNGKRFDWPLYQERLILNRLRLPLPHAHYDVLPPSRRLWRRLATDCSLTTLEGELLGHRRPVDVPGFLVPSIYFQYLRDRDPRPLVPVVEHNANDIVALAALAAVNHEVILSVGRDEEEGAPLFPSGHVDWVAVGRLWDAKGSPDLALRAFARADGTRAPEGALVAGALLKRLGRPQEAVPHWRRALLAEEPLQRLEALEELAKHEEWKEKRPQEARSLTESALTLLDELTPRHDEWTDRFRSRHRRLVRKSTSSRAA